MATGRYVVNDHHGYRFAFMPGSAGQAPSEEKKMMKRDENKMSKKRHIQVAILCSPLARSREKCPKAESIEVLWFHFLCE
jgi:hypothetical protein